MESNLIIEGVGFPQLSCRDVTQTLSPIPQGELYQLSKISIKIEPILFV